MRSTSKVSGRMRPVCSAKGINSPGGKLAAAGVLPAHERLDPDELQVAHGKLGLVVELELAAADRVTQVLDQQQPLGSYGSSDGS
jgi:hypothetical protein